jgi:hypothetical protein
MFITGTAARWLDGWMSGGMWIWTLTGVVLIIFVIVKLIRRKKSDHMPPHKKTII